MVAVVVVVLDEAPNLRFEITGQVIVLQQYPVLERLMPTLNLALGLGMVGCAASMIHALLVEPFSEISGDVAGAIVRQQPGFVLDTGLITTRGGQCHLQRVGDVLGLHRGAQLPGNDVARVVVEDGGQVLPSPANDLEVREVGLPHLVRCGRLSVQGRWGVAAKLCVSVKCQKPAS